MGAAARAVRAVSVPAVTRLARASLALLACACTLLTSACSGSDASTGPAAQGRPSLAPYVPPTAPPQPLSVAAVDRDGAVDAVMRFFDALNYGYARGDADPLRAMSTLGCSACVGWVQDVQRMADEHRHQDGGWIRVVGMQATGAAGGQFAFRASLLREPGTVEGDGTSTPVVAGGKGDLVDLVVAPQASSVTGRTTWTVVAMELVPMAAPTPSPGRS